MNALERLMATWRVFVMQMNEGKFVNKVRTRLSQIAIPAFIFPANKRIDLWDIFAINYGQKYPTTYPYIRTSANIYIYTYTRFKQANKASSPSSCFETSQLFFPRVVTSCYNVYRIHWFVSWILDSIEYLTFATNCVVTAGYLLNSHRAYQKEYKRKIHLLPIHFPRIASRSLMKNNRDISRQILSHAQVKFNPSPEFYSPVSIYSRVWLHAVHSFCRENRPQIPPFVQAARRAA